MFDWIASVTGACARLTLTRADQWYQPNPEQHQPLRGVWMQGPNGRSAFCVPEDDCSTLISVLGPDHRMIIQERHFADPGMP